MPFQTPVLMIGVSARIYYPGSPVLDLGGVWTKTLHYLEQSVAQWLMRGGALPVMVPAVDAKSLVRRTELNLRHYADALDGLVLQGGNDVAPESYKEKPLKRQWQGDAVRDAYEMELVSAFVEAGKPVFGICRGMQLLNVAYGGSLWQDLATQMPDAFSHFSERRYETNLHEIELTTGSKLAEMYPGIRRRTINSIHHQAIKKLAPDFVIEAISPADGVIEAIRKNGPGYMAAVQWHPEFKAGTTDGELDDAPILRDFLQAARCIKTRSIKGDIHAIQ